MSLFLNLLIINLIFSISKLYYFLISCVYQDSLQFCNNNQYLFIYMNFNRTIYIEMLETICL